MARMDASVFVKNCPVSNKAYFSFAQRIMSVVLGPGCELILLTLNRYLEGDRETYAEGLDEHLKMTFEMLRFEIDKAIERSARARARARVRRPRRPKAQKPAETSPQETKKQVKKRITSRQAPMSPETNLCVVPATVDCGEESAVDTPATPPVLTRRMRRAAARADRPRYKWQKIG